jgi:Holliday junction DNA helicase RuvA
MVLCLKQNKESLMLATIKGTVRAIEDSSVIIDVHGIGFTITVSNAHELQIGAVADLATYMHWSADNGPSLFGFGTQSEKKLFLALISCSGIGPKVALALMGKLGSYAVITALASGDQAALSSVSGVGPKKAEQIIVQLRSKVDHLIEHSAIAGSSDALRWKEVSDALMALNYSRPEVSKAMQHLATQFSGSTVPFAELLRNALAHLAKPMR